MKILIKSVTSNFFISIATINKYLNANLHQCRLLTTQCGRTEKSGTNPRVTDGAGQGERGGGGAGGQTQEHVGGNTGTGGAGGAEVGGEDRTGTEGQNCCTERIYIFHFLYLELLHRGIFVWKKIYFLIVSLFVLSFLKYFL